LQHRISLTETRSSELGSKVQDAFARAMLGQSNIDPAALELEGMSGKKYRHFANNLMASLADPSYLEVGIWRGSTLCSTISNNDRIRATAIDNWSLFGNVREDFLGNLARFKAPNSTVNVIEADFRSVDYQALGRHQVFLFDGPHATNDQYDGMVLGMPAVTPEAVILVDDWNWHYVREGTLTALEALGVATLVSIEVFTGLSETNGEGFGAAGDWHNGYFMAVIQQP
jgi:hypothetical protein